MKAIIIILAVLAGVWLFFWHIPANGIHWNTGSGSQVGYVSAVEMTGLFFKTGVAYIKPTLESTQEDVYCVIDERVFAQLKDASVQNTRVEVQHNSLLWAGFKNCEAEPAIINSVSKL